MDDDALESALRNLDRRDPDVRAALPILAAALSSDRNDLREDASHMAYFVGQGAKASDVEWLENQVADQELQLAARVVLLNYSFGKRRVAAEARTQSSEHIFWIIANAPDCPAAGEPGAQMDQIIDGQDSWARYRQAWLDAVDAHPTSAAVHINAAHAVEQFEWQSSARLLRRAIELEPENTDARMWLAQGHKRNAFHATPWERQVLSQLALKEFEELLALQLKLAERQAYAEENAAESNPDARMLEATTLVRSRLLHDLARAAFEANELEKAENYAQEGLAAATSTAIPEFFRHDGDPIHHNNLVLGRVALRRGDVPAAGRHLLDAGKTKGSPPLMSFGPNMQLAADLLEAGEKDVVLQYLDLCANFWKSGQDRLDIWKAKVRAGKPPLFGANLCY